jgi:hypothetical protein
MFLAIVISVRFVAIVLRLCVVQKLVSTARPLVRTDDKLAQELVAQAVEVFAVILGA